MATDKDYLAQLESGKVKTDDEAIHQAEAALREMQYTKELEERQWAAQEKIYKVVNDNMKILKPEHDYQTKEEFWEVQRELHTIQHERSKMQHDAQMNQIVKAITEREKVLDELKGE